MRSFKAVILFAPNAKERKNGMKTFPLEHLAHQAGLPVRESKPKMD